MVLLLPPPCTLDRVLPVWPAKSELALAPLACQGRQKRPQGHTRPPYILNPDQMLVRLRSKSPERLLQVKGR